MQSGFDASHAGFNPNETAITPDTVSGLQLAWSASYNHSDGDVPGMVVTADTVILNEFTGLAAFSRDGSKGCTDPSNCTPLWTTGTGYYELVNSPAVSNGIVYVEQITSTPGASRLLAFNATGTTGCTGTPVICAPLWTAPIAAKAPITVADGRLYVEDFDNQRLAVYDAAGHDGCGGTPVVCQPLWVSTGVGTPPVLAAPAVADGRVYVPGHTGLYVFDAHGSANCDATDLVCSPLWTAPTAGTTSGGPAVAGGRVFLPTSEPNPGGGNDLGRLYAFDGTGNANCAGTPNVCTPLWTAPTATVLKATNPIVADGTVFMPDATHLNAYDAAGSNGCAGVPTVCGPLWTALTQYPGQPAAAGGLVYTLTNPNLAAAFDAHGQRGCGGTPNQCSPLWTSPQPFYGAFTTVVSDGWAYTMTFASFRGHSLNAYRLPAP